MNLDQLEYEDLVEYRIRRRSRRDKHFISAVAKVLSVGPATAQLELMKIDRQGRGFRYLVGDQVTASSSEIFPLGS